jgi:hypothetical protein
LLSLPRRCWSDCGLQNQFRDQHTNTRGDATAYNARTTGIPDPDRGPSLATPLIAR